MWRFKFTEDLWHLFVEKDMAGTVICLISHESLNFVQQYSGQLFVYL